MPRFQVPTGPSRRVLVEEWTDLKGRQLVTAAPQYEDRDELWHLSHSGLMLRSEWTCRRGACAAAAKASRRNWPPPPGPGEPTYWMRSSKAKSQLLPTCACSRSGRTYRRRRDRPGLAER
jgi:hypothetical protein